MKRFLRVLAGLGGLVAIAVVVLINTTAGQNLLLERGISAVVGQAAPSYDGLNVFVCGSSSPLPAPGRAQACLAIITPEHYFIVDAGAGSAVNLGLANMPSDRLDGVLITHYHSDHIAELPTFNVMTWASGHQGPLKVYGPTGIKPVINGFNAAFAQDRRYRTLHHGLDFMPAEWGVMEAVENPMEFAMTFGDMTITSFTVSHSPVAPAVGYRFDYRGRSVVITGDTIVTDRLAAAAKDADLMFSDALSAPIVSAMVDAAKESGRDRIAHILVDIQDYHASVTDVAQLTVDANIGMTALYHLVPGPRNVVMENIYKREFQGNMLLTEDNMWFTLPVGSDAIDVH
ncbi:MAG: MBL fold metallo-hydrolase [Pseudomonadota bacterium]